MQNLQELVADAETGAELPPGTDERFSGYGVMSLPFASGHVLGLRRFPVTSVGPGYTSVWHRDPSGSWTIYTTVDPHVSCPRYFGSAIDSTSVHDIDITWSGDHNVTVSISDDVQLIWQITVAATPITRLMTSAMRAVPESGWRSTRFLTALGAAAGPSLRAGRVVLTGKAPNRQSFRASPRKIWFVDDSVAVLDGVRFGPIQALPRQTKLGDFWMPQRGIFMIGGATFDTFDPAAHLSATVA